MHRNQLINSGTCIQWNPMWSIKTTRLVCMFKGKSTHIYCVLKSMSTVVCIVRPRLCKWKLYVYSKVYTYIHAYKYTFTICTSTHTGIHIKSFFFLKNVCRRERWWQRRYFIRRYTPFYGVNVLDEWRCVYIQIESLNKTDIHKLAGTKLKCPINVHFILP